MRGLLFPVNEASLPAMFILERSCGNTLVGEGRHATAGQGDCRECVREVLRPSRLFMHQSRLSFTLQEERPGEESGPTDLA